MPLIAALDKNTIRSIHTGQVITSTESIVKELLENALDARASNVEVRLVNDGLQRIEVRDNGCGIALHDRSNMAKQHYTSKLSSFADLDRVKTYGFRGEALSSLCELSGEVFVTTKTKHDTIATCYKLSRNGNILSENASGSIPQTGTMVSIYLPFAHLPVRRQLSEKNKASSVKRIHELMVKYSLSQPLTRLSLNQQQSTLGKPKGQPLWIKPSTTSLTESVRIIYGATLASMVEECSFEESFDQQVDLNDKSMPTPVRLHCALPSKSSDPSEIFKGERVYVFVDKRPINYAKSDLKELVSMVRQRYKKVLGLEDDPKKIPFMYVDIQSGLGTYDVNIEPDKSVVMFVGKDRLLNAMQQLLDQTYGGFFNNKTLPSVAEKHSPNIDPALQEVPSHSPKVHQSPLLRSKKGGLDVRNDSPAETELDELDDNDGDNDDLEERAARNPPLLNDWLQQHSLADDIHKNQLPAVSTENPHMGNQSRAATANASLDWQINEDFDTITTTTSSPPPSAHVATERIDTQHQQLPRAERFEWQVDEQPDMTTAAPPSPSADVEHSTQLSNWFAQFRRPSNGSTNILKRPASSHHPVVSTPAQAKRAKVQLGLPFTTATSISGIHPIVSAPSSTSPVVSPRPSPSSSPSSPISDTDTGLAVSPPDAEISSMVQAISTPTQAHDISSRPAVSETTRDIFASSVYSSRRRDITSLFSKLPQVSPSSSSSTQGQGGDISLISTLNETMPFDTSTAIPSMSTNYNLYRRRYTQLHRKSVDEYHQQVVSLSKDQEQQSTWNSFVLGNKTNRDVAIFTKGTYTDIGWLENCLAVINVKTLQQRHKFQALMEEYDVKCGNPLEIPVQITISDNSPLYGVVIALDKRDESVANDRHGLKQQTYSLITDKRITANGFRARWRKEPYAQELVVQFTAIADLNGYGPTDFNETLQHIHDIIQQQHHGHGQLSYDDMNGKTLTPLKKIRPSKVVDYFASMVKDVSGSTLEKSSENDWGHMIARLDEETQNHLTNGKDLQSSFVHHLI